MPRPTPQADADNLFSHAIQSLRSEIAGLRDAIDELREVVEWGNRNRDGYDPLLFQFRRSADEPADMPEPTPTVPTPHDESPVQARRDDKPRRQDTLW